MNANKIIVKNNLVIMTIEQYVKNHSNFRTEIINEIIPVLEMAKNELINENITDTQKEVVIVCFDMIAELFKNTFLGENKKNLDNAIFQSLINIQNNFNNT